MQIRIRAKPACGEPCHFQGLCIAVLMRMSSITQDWLS